MSLQKFDLLKLPRAEDADAAYDSLEHILAGRGLTIFLVKKAAELGFDIRSKRGSNIIAAAGFVALNTITTVYGGASIEVPPPLHHDADYPVDRSAVVQCVHHHKTPVGKSRGLFVPVVEPPGIYLSGYADLASNRFDTDVFGEPAYEDVIEAGDAVLFVGNGPGCFAHRFPSLPDVSSRRVAELTLIDLQPPEDSF